MLNFVGLIRGIFYLLAVLGFSKHGHHNNTPL